MVAYYFSFKTALVKGSPNVVAANATALIYDVTDVNRVTPVTAYADAGLTVIKDLVTDQYGIVPDFYTNNLPDVLWKSGENLGQWATSQSRPGDRGKDGAPGAPGATGAPGAAGLNGAGTNADVAAYIPASGPTRDALDALYPRTEAIDAKLSGRPAIWEAGTAYTAGLRVISPGGDIVSAKADFTSGATYNAADWNASTQDGRVKVLESAANLSNLVTNGAFRDGLTGWTNTGAWVAQTSTNSVTSWARTMSGADGAFAQSIVIPARLLGSTLRLKVLAMTTSAGTLLTRITTTAGATSLNHTLTTSYVEYTLDVAIPAGQGTTPITLDIGRFSGTVYMTAIRLEAL